MWARTPRSRGRGSAPWTGRSRRSRSSPARRAARCVTTTTSGCSPPSRIGSNGYRHYDDAALVRLQRILLLRELGLGLPAIAEVLDREASDAHALRGHLEWLRGRSRTGWRGRSRRSSTPSEHWKEVNDSWQRTCSTASTTPSTRRRSRSAGARTRTRRATRWWRSMSADEKAAWQQRDVAARPRLDRGARAGHRPRRRRGAGARAAAGRVAARHPGHARRRRRGPDARSTSSASPRCTWPTSASARTTAARRGAEFVRDAMTAYAEREL